MSRVLLASATPSGVEVNSMESEVADVAAFSAPWGAQKKLAWGGGDTSVGEQQKRESSQVGIPNTGCGGESFFSRPNRRGNRHA